MLRRVENVRVTHHPGWLTGKGWLRLWIGKKGCYQVRDTKIHRDDFAQWCEYQQRYPLFLRYVGERAYWWFQDRFYWDNDGLSADQVYALLVTRGQRQQQQIARAQEIVAMGRQPVPSLRGAIPDDVKQLVWTRDGGQCRVCGSQVELQFDHIIPVILGGATSAENLQILCGSCNRRKGAAIVSPH